MPSVRAADTSGRISGSVLSFGGLLLQQQPGVLWAECSHMGHSDWQFLCASGCGQSHTEALSHTFPVSRLG